MACVSSLGECHCARRCVVGCFAHDDAGLCLRAGDQLGNPSLLRSCAGGAQPLPHVPKERSATDELRQANEMLERANVSFASALVAALDARDAYTAGHSSSVALCAACSTRAKPKCRR